MSEEMEEFESPAEPEPLTALEPEDRPVAISPEDDAEASMRRMSRRSFLWAALAAGAGIGGIKWLGSRRQEDGLSWPLRRALDLNDDIARETFFRSKLAPEFAPARAEKEPRTNGDLGLGEDFDPAKWGLTVQGLADENAPEKTVTLAQIKALPRVEMVTELKCIEGWSMIVNWGGVRLADFIKQYQPAKIDDRLPSYVGMSTPDGGYYVGLDMESALHPQTLLCYEMNGEPLAMEHGAPLRLAIPVKYGIKNIKRIGTLVYTDIRPADYWAERGYGYHAGH